VTGRESRARVLGLDWAAFASALVAVEGPLETRCAYVVGAPFGVSSDGWAIYRRGHVGVRLARLVADFLAGPIPPDHHVHHRCLDRRCCRAGHLVILRNSDHSRLHVALRRAPGTWIAAGRPVVPGGLVATWPGPAAGPMPGEAA